jgi:hypothetical protein
MCFHVYCLTLLQSYNMFVKKLIYLLVYIHQIIINHVVFCHFNSFENIEGIV